MDKWLGPCPSSTSTYLVHCHSRSVPCFLFSCLVAAAMVASLQLAGLILHRSQSDHASYYCYTAVCWLLLLPSADPLLLMLLLSSVLCSLLFPLLSRCFSFSLSLSLFALPFILEPFHCHCTSGTVIVDTETNARDRGSN